MPRSLSAPAAVAPSGNLPYNAGMSSDGQIHSLTRRSAPIRDDTLEPGAGRRPARFLGLPGGPGDVVSKLLVPFVRHVRRRGHRAAEAQDLIQEFFAGLLEKGTLQVADRDRGRFRSFLLAALDHFWPTPGAGPAPGNAAGDGPPLPGLRAGEGRYAAEPAHELTPDRLYARRWALT